MTRQYRRKYLHEVKADAVKGQVCVAIIDGFTRRLTRMMVVMVPAGDARPTQRRRDVTDRATRLCGRIRR